MFMEFLHWFIDPIKNKYMDFEGRATRQEFWMFVLILVGIHVILSIVRLGPVTMLV